MVFNNDHIGRFIFIAVSIFGIYYLLFFAIKKWSAKKKRFFPSLIQKILHLPGLLLCIAITADIFSKNFLQSEDKIFLSHLRHVLDIGVILIVGIFLVRVIEVVYHIILHHYAEQEEENYSYRSAQTKYSLIRRILTILVVIAVSISIGLTFTAVREMSQALLASAGVAGIVLGFAAQKSLAALFSGIQIALSQPVRIDDTVVVEGQFGIVGEINLTYVVINTWDEKKLIVPVNYFLENSFENWTRISPKIVGTVKVHADYNLKIEPLRQTFREWLTASGLWDGRKSALLITNATDKTIELRATMTAKNSDDAFDLECVIREKLITYLREQDPPALPAERLSLMPETVAKNTL